METKYYFIVENGGSELGPFAADRIAEMIASGTISRDASLLRVGEVVAVPIANVQLPLPRRGAQGTLPPPVPQPLSPPQPLAPPMALTLAPVAANTTAAPHVAPAAPRKRWPLYVIGGVAVVGAIAAVIAMHRSHGAQVKDAMVRITTSAGTGAGFFIDGPDQYAYVATANHLIDRGDGVLVERDVELDNKHEYVEAYPQTEVVAADPDSDLAIVRIKNLDASRFHRLRLAKEPVKDSRIFSYGFPGSSLAQHAGLVSKDGEVLSLVMFPAYDDRYARVLRENAVDGILVSADIEPGFSGGPTIDEAGDVVGVNVTKDHAHVGQNGAVSVIALRQLLARVKPASEHADPTPADIAALLKRVQNEYLLLPVDERSRVRETEFLAASDLPALRRFVSEVRREERNMDTAFLPKLHLSGQAALGIYFARLPGRLLDTYRAPSIASALATCEATSHRLASFLGDMDTVERHGVRPQAGLDTCDELAVRPLAWDLAAATLQWDGKEKDFAVTKLDRMDDEGRTYRASVRISGAANLIDVWIGMERGQPRLRLFDSGENLYAVDSPRSISATALQGTWVMKRPRVTDEVDKNAEVEVEENLAISIAEDRKVSLRHTIDQHYYIAGKKASSFPCNHKASIDVGLVQSFAGSIENGVVVALPEKNAEPIGNDAGTCKSSHAPDRIVAVKLVGEQLYLYRTDGIGYPETVTLTKQ
jgi:S1-C subfamily serine protease